MTGNSLDISRFGIAPQLVFFSLALQTLEPFFLS